MLKTPSQVASGTREPEFPLDATSGPGQDAAPADQQEVDGKRGRQRSRGDEARPKRQRKKKKKKKNKNKKQLDLLEREDDPLIQLRSLKEGVAPARLKCLDTLLNESRDLSEGNESKGNLLKRLIQKAELDLSQMKELETDTTSGASQSREEASAADSDGQGDDKETPGKGQAIIGYEAQHKDNNIQDVKTSSQQETRKPKRKKQKKRQRHKMEESTKNLSCRSGNPSSSHDGTSTSTIKGEPKQPSFGDLASIAQDHDDKIASNIVDIKQEQELAGDIQALLASIAQDHDDKIAFDTVDIKREQVSAGDIQALLNMDEDAIQEKFEYYLDQLGYGSMSIIFGLNTMSQSNSLSCTSGFAKLKEQYNPSILRKEGYFRHYDKSLEWYFNLEWCEYSGFHDYQQLVLHDNDDLAYVRYRARLANETKWIEDYLACDITQAERRRVKDIASVQALKIAGVSGGVYAQSALAGFKDHIWSIQFDFNHYKDFDGVYFEIWKRGC
uniref:Uncharacterized protein n=1 Tax=Oryza punctata TaxID=4537 RepID=A0A0E0KZ34_ORYPU